MEIRFIGPDQNGREVDIDGETVIAPRMEWVDIPTDTARSLAKQDVWELRGPKRAAATRRKNEADVSDDQSPEGDDTTEDDQ